VPLHADFEAELASEQLRAALASVPLASVRLHASVTELPANALPEIASALAGSSATLAALHGFPLIGPRDGPGVSLAALTQLRSLTLRQTLRSPEKLRASLLPASVEELRFTGIPDNYLQGDAKYVPELIGFHMLHNLRHLTFAGQHSWEVLMLDDENGEQDPMHLPPNLQVRLVIPEPALYACLLCACTL